MTENDRYQDPGEGFRYILPQRKRARTGWLGIILNRIPGRCIVEVTPQELRSIEHLGPIHWTARHPLEDLGLLVVAPSDPADQEGRFSLHAESNEQGLFLIASDYSYSKLLELKLNLEQAAGRWQSTPFSSTQTGPPDSFTSCAERDCQTSTRPATGSSSSRERRREPQIEHTATGVRVFVPAQGFRGGASLWCLGIIIAVFASIFEAVNILEVLSGNHRAWISIILASPFLITGLAMMVRAWTLGQRTALLTVDPDGLSIDRHSPFRDERNHFSRHIIDEVRVGPSGMKVNDTPVMELQVWVKGEKALGMLSQCTAEQCQEIAVALRPGLGLQPGQVV